VVANAKLYSQQVVTAVICSRRLAAIRARVWERSRVPLPAPASTGNGQRCRAKG
jgi:hypothetical protein